MIRCNYHIFLRELNGLIKNKIIIKKDVEIEFSLKNSILAGSQVVPLSQYFE
jgi:hypothetical protein